MGFLCLQPPAPARPGPLPLGSAPAGWLLSLNPDPLLTPGRRPPHPSPSRCRFYMCEHTRSSNLRFWTLSECTLRLLNTLRKSLWGEEACNVSRPKTKLQRTQTEGQCRRELGSRAEGAKQRQTLRLWGPWGRGGGGAAGWLQCPGAGRGRERPALGARPSRPQEAQAQPAQRGPALAPCPPPGHHACPAAGIP